MSLSHLFSPGLGWIPDLPDPRDFSSKHETVKKILKPLKWQSSRVSKFPHSIDLRMIDGEQPVFSKVYDQGILNCSCACAVLGLIAYFERRAFGHTFDGSVLFLYKMARKIRRLNGDSGVDLRTTLKTLVRYGVPPTHLWHEDPRQFDQELQDLSLIGFTSKFADMHYIRLDPSTTRNGKDLLQTIKAYLTAQVPVLMGFAVPNSVTLSSDIPYHPTFDSIRGGQAVLVVGYDEKRFPKSLLIRNSWGSHWGESGYGWLPFTYVTNNLVSDVWTLMKLDWFASGEFRCPVVVN